MHAHFTEEILCIVNFEVCNSQSEQINETFFLFSEQICETQCRNADNITNSYMVHSL